MRASRLLSLLLLLQTRGRMTAADLAQELEVSLRTVYRDIDALSAAGIPVYADRGCAGGYQLLDGYRTQLTGLTTDEAASLFFAGVPGPASELGLSTVLAAAQLKLLAALPPELSLRAEQMRARFYLDAPGWFHEGEPAPHLAAVLDAVWHQRVLEVRYKRWRGEVTRTLEPLGLVLKAGVWYLVARASDEVRTYCVSRILALAVLDVTFERPADFDLLAYWQAYSQRFEASLYHGAAQVRIGPRGLQLLRVLYDPAVIRAIDKTAGSPDEHGWIEATMPFESHEHALVDLLKLGAQIEVLEPPDLRQRMTETIQALAGIYTADKKWDETTQEGMAFRGLLKQ